MPASLLLLFAAACLSPSTDDSAGGGVDGGTTSGDDTGGSDGGGGQVGHDADTDGYDSIDSGGDDCDDTDAEIHPGATETWYDGVDQDCAGDSDNDADADSYDALSTGGTDCDDTDPAVNPAATETWYDGVDQDCAGDDDWDVDLDGYPGDSSGEGADCDDGDPAINPSATEIANDGIDQDCDGSDLASATVVGSDTDSGFIGSHAANYLLGQTVEVTTAFTLTDFGFVTQDGGYQVQFALYEDAGGEPGALVIDSETTTCAAGATTAPATTETLVDPGTYWLLKVVDAVATVTEAADTSVDTCYIVHTFGSAMPSLLTGGTACYPDEVFDTFLAGY